MEARTGYVYALLSPHTDVHTYGKFSFCNEPYYIGMSKGDESRKFYHINEAKSELSYTSYKINKIRKLIRLYGELEVTNNIVVIKDSLTPEEAANLEIELIKLIGRKDLGTGPLANLTAGGEGTVGLSKSAIYQRAYHVIDTRADRSVYSRNPEVTKKRLSESLTIWFDQNRNKTFDDLPYLKYRRYYSKTLHGRSGTRNGMAKFYYLVVTDDGGYHLASKGCMKYLAEILDMSHTTIECSARENERRLDNKFARIVRGNGQGSFCFRFESLKDCPVNITIGNQQPRPNLPG